MEAAASASLSPVERRVLERWVERLAAEFGDDLESVWLYGSRARGERPGPESDVDLLVVARGERYDNQGRAIDLAWAVAKEVDANPLTFSIIVWTPEWLVNRRAIESFFVQEVDRDKLVLAGRP